MWATPTTTPRYALMKEQLQKETWTHTLEVLQTPSVGKVCEYPEVSSFLNSYLVLELVYVLGSCSIKKWKKWEELPWWQYYLHQQDDVVNTLNVLLLTLNKALPGGRPKITRFVLMPISLWIKLNHASCSLYLSLYICSGLNVWHNTHIHWPFKSSMVFGLKCLLRSNWHGVKFDWLTSELILV